MKISLIPLLRPPQKLSEELIELRGLTTEKLPAARQSEAERELTRALNGLDKHLIRERSEDEIAS